MRWFIQFWNAKFEFTEAELTKPTGSAATSKNIIKWKQYVLEEGHLFRNSHATTVVHALATKLIDCVDHIVFRFAFPFIARS